MCPLSIPERPWWAISLDFITGVPMTADGHDAILTVVDRLTRMVHAIPTTTNCDALQFAKLMKRHIFSQHGVHGDIVSDRGSIFTGHFWSAACKHLSVHLSMSTAFHPQSDDSTEIVNKMVEQVLRCYTMLHQKDWDNNLCMAEFAINNSYHTSTKHTPFFLNYGMHLATPVMVETIKASKLCLLQQNGHMTSTVLCKKLRNACRMQKTE